MANPQVHSRSSARKFGGVWQDYIEVHSFLDSSKLHIATANHRALLHHEFGKRLAMEIFANQPNIEAVIDQHFSEDFTKFTPSVAKWFEVVDVEAVPKLVLDYSILEQCDNSVKIFGGAPEDYFDLHEFIDSITEYSLPTWGITHSTFGLYLAEMKFGYVVGPRDVPTRTVAEKHILAEYGTIPSAQDWLKAVRIQPWMYNQASQLSAILEQTVA